jgi:hypothetical protein
MNQETSTLPLLIFDNEDGYRKYIRNIDEMLLEFTASNQVTAVQPWNPTRTKLLAVMIETGSSW